MPKKNQRRTNLASSPSSSVTATMTTGDLSIKDMMNLVPQFSTPARIWAEKILLVWPSDEEAPKFLIDIIKTKLPPQLFDNVKDQTFGSHVHLLDKIRLIEGPSKSQANQALLETKVELNANRTPREYFNEMKRLAEVSFPDFSFTAQTSLAWRKLIAALPSAMQQTLILFPNQDYSEATLDDLDRAWKLHTPTASQCSIINQHSHSTASVLEEVQRTLSSINARLQAIEVASPVGAQHPTTNAVTHHSTIRHNTSSDPRLCYYHQRFGRFARRCTAPCQYQRPGN
jgi:hypothetical protein